MNFRGSRRLLIARPCHSMMNTADRMAVSEPHNLRYFYAPIIGKNRLRLCSIGSFSSITAPFREPLDIRDPIKSARSEVGHTSLGTRIDDFCPTGKRTSPLHST